MRGLDWVRAALFGLVVLGWQPAAAVAQDAPQPSASTVSNVWFVAGAGLGVERGDCQECEEDYPYRKSPSVLINVGRRLTERADVGVEVFWMPVEGETARINATHIDAIAQVRLWDSQGFFLKGGAGIAFVRNWVDSSLPESIRQKGLSVVIGGGWAFRPKERIGWELFASQHVVGLGDFQVADDPPVQDVVGNFWSVGVALVIR